MELLASGSRIAAAGSELSKPPGCDAVAGVTAGGEGVEVAPVGDQPGEPQRGRSSEADRLEGGVVGGR
jgi:hypothetical protein